MKKNNSNVYFVVGIIVLVVGLLVGIGFINKHQEAAVNATLPTVEEYESAYTGEVTDFEYDKQPSLGSEDAPVKVVEFGDFKCSHCGAWEKQVFPLLKEDYIDTGKVEFYFINWQFLAVDSYLAGVAGEIIYNQNEDAFWQYYKAIYDNQGLQSSTWATESFLIDFVKEHVKDVDYVAFEKDLKARKYMDDVRKDFLIGQKYGMTGTPGLYVNGIQVENSYQSLAEAIELNLAEVK